MVRTKRFSLLWLGVVFLPFSSSLSASPPADNNSPITSTLALQQAMATATEYLHGGNNKKAVEILEEQLSRVNGHAEFLRLLRVAYRGYIKDLWIANNGAAAKRYLERLCILEPSASTDTSLRPP